MARRNPLLLLVVAVVGLCAGLAGFSLGSAPSHGAAAFAPAELRALDTSPGTRPALTRGAFAMAAVESSRRKLRAPQRPPAQPLILAGRATDAPAPAEWRLRPAPDLPLETARANRPFPARGPPV